LASVAERHGGVDKEARGESEGRVAAEERPHPRSQAGDR